ncbi:hypothetical protein O1611_g1942 [Lasiodiplodia mahajangana]|uniref:Uncharacterized protein n=1 Tax=Lasiodiplodia mahajangana TaxID=1108764 RepID=A0ACC2JWM7_9PEZI|nr:hypothetical protein O1611_g1942 [Lasiodiplodia mahajangana]
MTTPQTEPDVQAIANSPHLTPNNVEPPGNLPAANGGAEILRELRRLSQRLESLSQRLESLSQRLETRLDASDANNFARLMNRDIKDREAPLWPLYSSLTNEPIENFPATAAHIRALRAADVDSILRQLRQPVNGSLPEKKRLLKMVIGATRILEE